MTPYQEDKQSNLKMGKRPEQTLLQGGHTEGPETHEKMLNITSHQRDVKTTVLQQQKRYYKFTYF